MTIKLKATPEGRTSRALGAAFLFQAVASVIGALLLSSLIVTGDISATMTRIASNALQMSAGIVVEMMTAVGIVILSVLLYVTLKKQNQRVALVALGLRLVEAALLAASRVPAFALLRTSQESVVVGHPSHLQTLGNLLLESQAYAYSLNMLMFALGATLFYYLFFRSRSVPRGLSIFGLIAAPLAIMGTVGELLGMDVPIMVFVPNLPFEVAIGLWLVIKGMKSGSPRPDTDAS